MTNIKQRLTLRRISTQWEIGIRFLARMEGALLLMKDKPRDLIKPVVIL